MKYIKKFESNEENGYWIVPTDDRFEKSLIDLDVPSLDYYIYNERIPKNDYIYVVHNDNKNMNKWGWDLYDGGNVIDDFLESKGLEFKGTINIADYELDAQRYNL